MRQFFPLATGRTKRSIIARLSVKAWGALFFSAIAASSSYCVPSASADTLLCGSIEYNDGPDVQSFAKLIWEDNEIPCDTKMALERLIRAAGNTNTRQSAWRRMLHQELAFASHKCLERIADYAIQCSMPLR